MSVCTRLPTRLVLEHRGQTEHCGVADSCGHADRVAGIGNPSRGAKHVLEERLDQPASGYMRFVDYLDNGFERALGIGAPFLTVAILPHRRHLRVIGAK